MEVYTLIYLFLIYGIVYTLIYLLLIYAIVHYEIDSY